MKSVFSHCLRLLVLSMKLTLYALYGAYRFLFGLVRLPGRVTSARRLLGESVTCPWCDEKNLLTGRFTCRSCGGTYLGFVGRCGICRAACSYLSCVRCRGSVVIGGSP